MGQEHSVPAPRRIPNKLSKPRTNSTPNLLSRSALQLGKDGYPVDVPGHGNRFSVIFADPEIRVEPTVEKKDAENKRRSVFRSWSTPDKETLGDGAYEGRAIESEDVGRWEEKARHSSMVEEPSYHFQQSAPRPVNVTRLSLQHVPTYQNTQRLSRVTEVSTPEPETSKRLSTYAELRSPTMTSAPPVDLPRNPSDSDLFTPMRRRSFLQHGVATRPNLDDGRVSLPSQIDSQVVVSQYMGNARPPLAYLTSLKQQDMPRVQTPDDLGYRHTGAFKLGSLRITNGTASPAPSIDRAVTMSTGEDYIGAGNLRRVTEGHLRIASNRSNTLTIPGEKLRSPWVVREESPLRRTEKYSEEPPRIEESILDLDLSLADFDFDSTLDLWREASPITSQEMADEYIQDIALSPYSFVPSRTPSPHLEPTSKHTAIEDELFEAEPLTPSLSHTPSNTDSGYEPPSRNSSDPRQKKLAKADSGYSSNFSVRSFKVTEARAPPVPPKDLPPTPPNDSVSRIASSTYSVAAKSARSSNADSAFARESEPVGSRNTVTILDKEYHAIIKSISQVSNAKQITVTQASTKTHKTTLASAPNGPRSIPKKKHARSGSDPKGNMTDSRLVPSKKEKQRPYSVQPQTMMPIFTIQAQGQGEAINVPPVSAEASRQLENRVDSFPMSSFTSTFKGLRRTGSKETLGTIFSVGSGFTEAPKQELTSSRLQEKLPVPPEQPLATSNSYHPPKTPPKKLQKRSSLTHDMAAYQDLDFGLLNSVTQSDARPTIDSRSRYRKRSPSMTSEFGSDTERGVMMKSRTPSSQTSTTPSSLNLRTTSSRDLRTPSSQTVQTLSSQDLRTPSLQTVKTPSQISKTPSSQDLRTPSSQTVQTLSSQDLRTPSSSQTVRTLSSQDLRTPSLQTMKTPSSQNSRTPSSQNINSPSPQDLRTLSSQDLRTPLSQTIKTPSSQDLRTPSSQNINSPSPQDLRTLPSQAVRTPSSKDMRTLSSHDLRTLPSQALKSPSSQDLRSLPSQALKSPSSQDLSSLPSQTRTIGVPEVGRLTSTTSYDSISSQHIYIPSSQSAGKIAPGPRSAPLQPRHFEQDSDSEDSVQRRLSWGYRDKKQPPISMQTQRKVTPTPVSTYSLFPTPPRRPGPVPIAPISKDTPRSSSQMERGSDSSSPAQPQHAPPPPPIHKSLPPLPTSAEVEPPLRSPPVPQWEASRPVAESKPSAYDMWVEEQMYWSDRQFDNVQDQRRPSLPGHLSSLAIEDHRAEQDQRPSMTNRHSSSTIQSKAYRRPPSVHQNGNLRIQKSMEAVRARQFMEQRMYMQSTPNLRQTHHLEDSNNPKTGSLAKLRKDDPRKPARGETLRSPRERDTAGEMLGSWQQQPDGPTPGEYHHAYGLPLPISPYLAQTHNKENRAPSPEKEYFGPSSDYHHPDDDDNDFAHYRELNRRHNSTSDMLVLDRFSGGLDYGYESGFGVGGSAGTRGSGALGGGARKSVDASRVHGLDFSDVPVFLTRVPGAEGVSEVRYRD